MEAGADTQQSGETAVAESEAQHITLAQVNPLCFSPTAVKKKSKSLLVSMVTAWLCATGVYSSGPGFLQ